MKVVHLSDLHLGKRLNEYSLIDDQTYILDQILRIIDDIKPDAVAISGDVYDKSIPSAEAVSLLDDFLVKLSAHSLQVLIISGNHDSPERLSFGSRLMRDNIHIAPVYDGTVAPVELTDASGAVRFYLLPFVKPAHVRRFYPDAKIESYTDAIRVAVEQMELDTSVRNVLVAHQFVTGASRSDSEEVSVGGLDNVDASVFAPFDYVALGHIHGPQTVGRPEVRYCGTPLKYSFSEKDQVKSITVADLGPKGSVKVSTVPLTPLRDLREIKGTYDEIMLRRNYEGTNTEDYVRIVLTDEDDVPLAMDRIRSVYPNIMDLKYDNTRTRSSGTLAAVEAVEKKSEIELFQELYEAQNGQPMSKEQMDLAEKLISEIKEGDA